MSNILVDINKKTKKLGIIYSLISIIDIISKILNIK